MRDVGLEGWAWSWMRLLRLISEMLADEHCPLAQPRVWFWERQFWAESEAGVIGGDNKTSIQNIKMGLLAKWRAQF